APIDPCPQSYLTTVADIIRATLMTSTDISPSGPPGGGGGLQTGGLSHAYLRHRRVRLDWFRRRSRAPGRGPSGRRARPLGCLGDCPHRRRSAAAASDGVIHLAFKHDLAFSGDFQGAADADRRAVETLGEALAGTDQPFVLASGLLGIAPGRVATEQDGHDLDPAVAAFGEGPQTRQATAQLVLSLASQGVRSSVM